ncbi:MAG: DUF4395 domain-containing protein [Arcobacteraceae bacterium]|jgi:hypothetical protein|nr:DUF4395 domain-containing protein [Arcobacteraceae bacterium]
MKNKQTNQIYFGEVVEGYDIRVLNEREARAGAGILFLFGFISFTNAYVLHNFTFTKIFVTIFMIDFIIRIFINPKFSPSLLLGRMFIQNQIPEYVAAPQKRWAWFIGLYLSIIMFLLIVVFNIMTPIKIFICILCLLLLFSEATFGICIGCKLFNIIYKENPKLCPGGVCQIRERDEIQKFSSIQKSIVVIFILIIIAITYSFIFSNETTIKQTQEITNPIPISTMKCAAGKCGNGK